MKKTQSIISVCLCLILLFSVVSSPIRAHAAIDPFTLYAVGSIFASLVISGLTSEIVDNLPDLVDEITNMVNENRELMLDLMEDSYTADRSKMTFSEAFMHELAVIIRDSPALLSILGLEADYIEMQLSRVEDQTVTYVPSEELLERPALITEELLQTGDFAEALAWNNVLLHDIKYKIVNLNGSINMLRSELITWTGNINDTVAEFGRDTEVWLGNVNSSVSTWGRSTVDWIKTVNSNLATYSNKIVSAITNLESHFLFYSDNLALKFDALLEVFPALSAQVDTIIEKIPAYVEDTVVVQKPAIDVQVGAETLVVSDYASMGQAFSAKMSWVPQIFDFLRELRSRLNSGTPPKVSINLAAAEGSYDWGGSAYVLDMTWYAKYKPSVDTVISGIMWLCFGWAIYKRIPDIISGVGLTVENATEPRGHVWSDRAERSASLSYRQERRADYLQRKYGRD